KWGSRLKLPSRIIEIEFKPRSKNTVLMVLDEGWQVSFRIHNARSMIEPSLKFDINLKGHPDKLTSHSIPYV
ncbi:MAG: HaeIII family restriction endonuclease, partial [Gammaproteobacteria bacterium]|nr:HaeIII family restriction endonuclease [Gammaproteobacteria bacterium]